MSLPASPARGPRHVPQERRKLSHISIYSKKMQALIVLAVGRGERRIGKGRAAAKEGVMAGLVLACPGHPRRPAQPMTRSGLLGRRALFCKPAPDRDVGLVFETPLRG
jgi:hypothetical protein